MFNSTYNNIQHISGTILGGFWDSGTVSLWPMTEEGLTNERAKNAHDPAETRCRGTQPDHHFANPTLTAKMGAFLNIATSKNLRLWKSQVSPVSADPGWLALSGRAGWGAHFWLTNERADFWPMTEGLTNERAANAHDTAETSSRAIWPERHFSIPTLTVGGGAIFPARQPNVVMS